MLLSAQNWQCFVFNKQNALNMLIKQSTVRYTKLIILYKSVYSLIYAPSNVFVVFSDDLDLPVALQSHP